MISINIFCNEAEEMLKVNDNIIDPSILMIGNTILIIFYLMLSDEGFKNILEMYNEIEGKTSLTNHYLAFEYIHDCITNRKKSIGKEKVNELKIEVMRITSKNDFIKF